MKIDGRLIGIEYPPYIIAEMSANHNGSLQRALDIIRMARDAGADAVKLQTYTADTMTLDVDHPRFRVKGDNPWDGAHLYDLYKQAAMPWEWHQELFGYGNEIGITIFSSPFDATAVELLQSLDAPAYKIASFELVDLELIRLCASTGKPLIMSTGMSSLIEIAEAVDAARAAGANNIILLKCTSAYPASSSLSNLNSIPHLQTTFNTQVGLSDHTMGLGVPIAATAIGATVIEKHFTLARNDGGIDSSFSLEPDELTQLVNETKNAHVALGHVTYQQGDQESSFKKYRRSLYFVNDLPNGAVISKKDIQALRPGDGLLPKYLSSLIGRTLKVEVTKGTPVAWDLLA